MRMARSLCFVSCSLGLALSASSQRAEACSCPGVWAPSPSDGAQGVPLNAEVKFIGLGYAPAELALFSEGRIVESQLSMLGSAPATYMRLRPKEFLVADHEYEVATTVRTEDGGVQLDRVLSRFRTGGARDDVPPQDSSVHSVEALPPPSNDESLSSCGATSGFSVLLPPGADNATPSTELMFHVYLGVSSDSIAGSQPRLAINSGGMLVIGNSLCGFSIPRGSAHWVGIRAVDWAGNESTLAPPVELVFNDSTAQEPIASGASRTGCTAAEGAASPVAALAILAALARARRVRRSARARS